MIPAGQEQVGVEDIKYFAIRKKGFGSGKFFAKRGGGRGWGNDAKILQANIDTIDIQTNIYTDQTAHIYDYL